MASNLSGLKGELTRAGVGAGEGAAAFTFAHGCCPPFSWLDWLMGARGGQVRGLVKLKPNRQVEGGGREDLNFLVRLGSIKTIEE